MSIVFVGTDLAKNVFALHGVDEHGKAALVRPAVRRDQWMELADKLPLRPIGMETSSHAK
jgi:transposase